MNFRDRCKEFYQKQGRDAMLRQGDPVQAIMEFVQSEIGRSADEQLTDAKSLILYFATDQDREEFVKAVQGVKPGMVSKRVP